MKWLTYIPWALILLRATLAPLAVFLAYHGYPRWIWLLQFAIAVLSDWYDGKLARRWGVVTAGLRQADSVADTFYALAILGSLWLIDKEIILNHLFGIGLVIGLETVRYPLDWVRFGRGASYHAISARLFGASLVIATIAIIGFDTTQPYLWICIALGVVSELEGIAISMILPQWTHDVAHIGVAMQIRRKMKKQRQ